MEKLLCINGPLAGQFVEVADNTCSLLIPTEEGGAVMYRRETLRDWREKGGLPMDHKLFFLPTAGETVLEHLLTAYRQRAAR